MEERHVERRDAQGQNGRLHHDRDPGDARHSDDRAARYRRIDGAGAARLVRSVSAPAGPRVRE